MPSKGLCEGGRCTEYGDSKCKCARFDRLHGEIMAESMMGGGAYVGDERLYRLHQKATHDALQPKKRVPVLSTLEWCALIASVVVCIAALFAR